MEIPCVSDSKHKKEKVEMRMKNQKQRPEVMKVRKNRKSTRGMAEKALLISAALSAVCCMSGFAGQCVQDATGWTYQNDDESF